MYFFNQYLLKEKEQYCKLCYIDKLIGDLFILQNIYHNHYFINNITY